MFLLALACHPDPTPGQPRSRPEPTQPVTTVPAPVPAVVLRINEVMSQNKNAIDDGDGDSSDWIELYNPGPDPVDLAGWSISDHPGERGDALPAKVLEAGGFALLWASGKGSAGPAGEIHLSFQLDATGETLVLSDPTGLEVDRLEIPALGPDLSYGLDEPLTEERVVADGTAARFVDAPAGDWSASAYDDSDWMSVTLPVGFDGSVPAGEPAEREDRPMNTS